jgi:type I restriction enzyme S subunit
MGSEWPEVQIADLVAGGALAVNDGYRVRNEELGPVGIPFVRGGDIRDGIIETTVADHIRPEFESRVGVKLARPGDVAFISKGTVGRVGRMRAGQPSVVFAPQVSYYRVLNPMVIDAGFLYYSMCGADFQASLYGVMTHGSMVADYVSLSQQLDFTLRLPDVETQRRIAGILGALDDKIELNRRMSQTLESMARALFKSWFVDFDPVRAKAEGRNPGLPPRLAALFPESFGGSSRGAIPTGWRASTVGDEFRVTMGQSPPGDTYNQTGVGMPFYQGRADFGSRFPSRRVFCTAATRLALAADTLVCVRAPVGDVNQAWEDCAIGRGLAAVRHKSGATSYTFLAMRSLEHSFATFEAGGTVFGAISKDDFRDVPMLVPSARVVLAFEELAVSLDHDAAYVHAESSTLAAMRDALLPALVSGDSWPPSNLTTSGGSQPCV